MNDYLALFLNSGQTMVIFRDSRTGAAFQALTCHNTHQYQSLARGQRIKR